jgi:DNA repair photolyase
MNVIYEPAGAAREYAPLAANLYWGCNHACEYCYVPAVLRRKPAEFHAEVRPRENILAKLEKDAAQIAGDPRQILLCFTCDPYPTALSGIDHRPQTTDHRPEDDSERSKVYGLGSKVSDVTRPALQILERHRLTATVLTKGGIRAARDFDILEANGWSFGTSLVWWRDPVRATFEPNAACVGSRVNAIRIARRMGIRTWLSLEPVIDLQEAILVIRNLADDVDHWWIGKLNHAEPAYSVGEWAEFKGAAEILLKGREFKFKAEK